MIQIGILFDEMISHSLRCVYIHVPKTGGHSIDRFFRDRALVSIGRWHDTVVTVRDFLGPGFNYYFFGTVRNPWDRFFSEYLWQKSNFPTQLATPWGRKDITFEDFCKSDLIWYPDHEVKNGHTRDQAHFLFDEEDRLLVDDIVRFESLQN